MSTPKAPPPKKRDAAATRRRLLATAERAFVERGFDGTRVDEIADQARVNKRMIYVYFGDKERLYLEVLRTNLEQVLEATREIASGHRDPVRQAEAVIRRYFGYCADHPSFVRLLSWESLSGGKRVGEVIAGLASAGIDELHDILQRGVDCGAFRAGLDVPKVVFSVHALCVSYFSRRELLEAMWGEDISREPVRGQVLDHILSTVMHGIVAPTTSTDIHIGESSPGGSNP